MREYSFSDTLNFSSPVKEKALLVSSRHLLFSVWFYVHHLIIVHLRKPQGMKTTIRLVFPGKYFVMFFCHLCVCMFVYSNRQDKYSGCLYVMLLHTVLSFADSIHYVSSLAAIRLRYLTVPFKFHPWWLHVRYTH